MVVVIGDVSSWVDEFFVRKGDLFLRVLNARWKNAEQAAGLIAGLLDGLGVGRGSRVLDLGCGNGRISVYLAKLGYRVVGVDISPLYIEDAWRKAREHGVVDGVEFIVGDARRIDEVVGRRVFDAVFMYWTTIIGYYGDVETDIEILSRIRRITRPGGYLLILSQASYESAATMYSFCGTAGYMDEIDEETILVEKPVFDPISSTIESTWIYYRKKGQDLEYIGETRLRLRLYTLHELVSIAEKAGWKLKEVYGRLKTLEPYKPGLTGLNLILQNPAGEAEENRAEDNGKG